MEKNNMSDKKSSMRKKSIKDIPLSGNRKTADKDSINHTSAHKRSDINLKKEQDEDFVDGNLPDSLSNEKNFVEDNKKPKKRKRRRKTSGKPRVNKLVAMSGTIIAILILIIMFMNVFAKATVTLAIKKADVSLDNLEIEITDLDDNQDENELGYKNINYSQNAELTVEASQEELVQQKATGRIMVYNSHSSDDQNWIQNTRFQSPDGLIYRSPVGVTIPGYTEVDGQIKPGKIEIEVVADEVGPEYNLPSGTTFTVPAFEGQDSFDSFSAEATTNLTGGFDGVRKIVDESNLENAMIELEKNLESLLKDEADSRIPSELIAFYPEDAITFDQINQEDGDGDNVELSLTGNISVLVIDKNDLAVAIAQKEINDYREGEDVYISNLEDLNLELIEDDSVQYLNLSGEINIVWDINSQRLAEDLSGKSQSEMRDILAEYRGVNSASVEFSPFWKKTFPEKTTRININKI